MNFSPPLATCQILAQLIPQRIGSVLEILEEIDSTNTYLLGLPVPAASHGRVVAAETQTGGRGRHGRMWFSPPGRNLSFSVILRSAESPGGLATLAGACAAVAGLREAGVPAKIKWPNDVIHRGSHGEERKLGGVLCETRKEVQGGLRLVLGIGLNVNLSQDEFPEELRSTAGSVRNVLGCEVDRNGLLAAILVNLDTLWTGMERDGGKDLVGLARQYCDTLGHLVELNLGMGTIEGIAEDLDEAGRLILRLESGARRLLEIGEIQQTRRMD